MRSGVCFCVQICVSMFICNKNLYKWIYVYMHTTFFWIFSLGLRKYVFTFNLFHVIFAWYYVYNTTWHLEIRKFRLRNRRRQWHPTPVLLPWKSHGRRTLVGFSPWGRKESDTTEQLHFHFSFLCTGEGNGNPLQCSCLENPRDGGAWWAAVYGVAQCRTWLKWLSSSSSRLRNVIFLRIT